MATLRQLAASLSDSEKGLYSESPYPNRDREYKRKLRDQLHTLDTLGPYSATYRKFRLKEAPTT